METDEDEPKLERAPSQRREKMLSGDCSPGSFGLSGHSEGATLAVIDHGDRSISDPATKRGRDLLLPQASGNVARRAATVRRAMPSNHVVKAFLNDLNHAAAPSDIVVWDVGANDGGWSNRLMQLLPERHRNATRLSGAARGRRKPSATKGSRRGS